ncbi:MAG: FmdB family zinc ribbon protein [Chloroflexota bacterium]
MPNYNYQCLDCQKSVRLFFSYADYGKLPAICPHCQSDKLKRQIGRIRIGRSEESRIDAFVDENALSKLDGDDPQALGQFMKKMSRDLGEDIGDDFNEVVDRLEKGETPEKIEKVMPELRDNTSTTE